MAGFGASRSLSFAFGMALPAPKPTPMIILANGEVGWTRWRELG
jgi:hypothetical protein